MKCQPFRPELVVGLMTAALLLTACDPKAQPEKSQPSASAPDAPPRKADGATSAKGSSSKASGDFVVDGERFTTRTVQDEKQGLPVCVFRAPEKWRDRTEVVWNYADVSNPVSAAGSIENPDNDEAFFSFAAARCFWCTPNYGFSKPGQKSLGLLEAQRIPAAQALQYVVQQARGREAKLKLIGTKDLPELAASLKMPPSDKERGVGLKVTYEHNGHPVEEEFYGIYYSVDIPYDGPQGRSWQNNWGLYWLHSFRAPLGTLDKRRPVFAAIAKSFRQNPAWQQRKAAIDAYLSEQFNQQLQAGYNQIAAAAQLSRQISANNDAMIASIDRRLQSTRSTAPAATRSSTDNFDDYIRGVETVNDPMYGTSQHSSTEQYHWTDGYGGYRHANDATYNPNQSETGGWQLMEPAR